jgi:hypothetical protein
VPEGNSELWRALQHGQGGKGPVFRRRRRFQGATWTPEKDSALSTDGFWCKNCRVRHGAMSKNVLGAQYEKRNGVWYILWICKKSGNVIHETSMRRRRDTP